MLKILNQIVEGDYTITEYTVDGKSVHAIVKTLTPKVIDEPVIPIIPKPTLEELVVQLQQDNIILMDALATAFEEIIMLREDITGGAV